LHLRGVKNTRNFLCVVLACLLVAIQQFGFAHALSHLASPNSQRPTRNDTQHPAEKVCTECVAFAQIGAALTGHAPVVAAPAPRVEIVAAPVRVFDPEFIPAFRSRAPPALV
jgi:hypothetical protein